MHDTITVTAAAWAAISSGTITGEVRIQNQGGAGVHIQATTGAAPGSITTRGGSLYVPSGSADMIDLAVRFPGVAGATALFAIADYNQTALSVSHG